MRRRWGIFKRMLMSYLVITLIPFVLLAVCVIEVTNESYAQSLMQKSLLELDRAQAVLDVRMTEILSMAYQLSENTVLFSEAPSPYTQYENVDKIDQLCVGNQFVKNIALWHVSRQSVYTSSGMMTKATYVEEVLKMEGEACDLQERIQNGDNYFFFSAGEGGIVYAVPCRLAKGNEVMALFLFDANAAMNLLAREGSDTAAYAILQENGGAVLSHTLPENADVLTALEQECISLNGESYRVVRTQSGGRVKLISLIPERQLTIPLDQITVMLVLAVVLLMGCVGLSTWMAAIHFKPVRKLGQMLTHADKSYNNWEELHQDVYETIRQNEEYIETILGQKRLLQEHNLLRLLYGEVAPDKLAETAADMGLGEGAWCCAACVRIGGVEHGLGGLRSSYLQALAALEFVAAKEQPQGEMLDFAEMMVKQESAPSLKEHEIYINLALKQGDEALAKENLNILLRWIGNAPRARVHYVCYSLLEIIVPVVAEAFGEENADTLRQSMTAEINAGRLDSFHRMMEDAVGRICAERKEQTEHSRDERKMEVLACVHEKYTDSMLSLEFLAERFGFSNFYWSRYFKEVIGQNFNDYVWTLRLERAKQLLATSMPLAEVVEQVGYIDVRSFTRRFKNAMGVTPAQYKKEQEALKKPPQE